MNKKVDYEYMKEYNRTKKGIITRIYSAQRNSSRKRGHSMPTYTKDDLKEWLYAQDLFHVLYDNWQKLEYPTMLRPSVDRIDDYVGYTLTNIQLMTWQENNTKSHSDRKIGKNKSQLRAVIQLNKDEAFVKEYHSVNQAARETGLRSTSIIQCCRGNNKSSGGYLWRYKLD